MDLPTTTLNVEHWTYLQGISLVDLQFHTPDKINLLIGAKIFMDIVHDGKIREPIEGSPTL